MPISNREIAQLQKVIARLKKRQKRWIEKRDTRLFKWALEGFEVSYDTRRYLFSWEITSVRRQIEAYTARLKEVKRDAQ